MDQAEALLNLQSRRSTRQSKPTKHPDFLYTDADFLDERDLFSQHQSSFTDPSDTLRELRWNTSPEQRENMAAVTGSSSENETHLDRALNNREAGKLRGGLRTSMAAISTALTSLH